MPTDPSLWNLFVTMASSNFLILLLQFILIGIGWRVLYIVHLNGQMLIHLIEEISDIDETP